MSDRLKEHQADYTDGAYRGYTISELGWWIHLFHMRTHHRSNPKKAKKDLYDAKSYHYMMGMKLKDRAKELNIDWDDL